MATDMRARARAECPARDARRRLFWQVLQDPNPGEVQGVQSWASLEKVCGMEDLKRSDTSQRSAESQATRGSRKKAAWP